jgi:hypothetical protein
MPTDAITPGPLGDVLKYGALSIGALILVYTAGLLTIELKRDVPRPEGRNLILMFMVFCVVAFAIAGGLEFLGKEKQVADLQIQLNTKDSDCDGEKATVKEQCETTAISKMATLVSDVMIPASSMDASLDAKLNENFSDLEPDQLRRLENYERGICGKLAEIYVALSRGAPNPPIPGCIASLPPSP